MKLNAMLCLPERSNEKKSNNFNPLIEDRIHNHCLQSEAVPLNSFINYKTTPITA